jgi:methyl-accepting chemotaxis protein
LNHDRFQDAYDSLQEYMQDLHDTMEELRDSMENMIAQTEEMFDTIQGLDEIFDVSNNTGDLYGENLIQTAD